MSLIDFRLLALLSLEVPSLLYPVVPEVPKPTKPFHNPPRLSRRQRRDMARAREYERAEG